MPEQNIANQTTKKPHRRWPWLVLAIALIALGVAAVGLMSNAPGRGGPAAAAQMPSGTVVVVSRGDLSSSATASGQLKAQRAAQLSLGVAGTVEKVDVGVGDTVKAGDVLVQLDGADLARQVATAEQGLIIQQANLAELKDGSSAEDLASAQASLDSARAHLEDVKDGPDAAEIAAARASLRAAEEAYADLQAGPDEDQVTQAAANLKNAEAALKQAQAAYDRVAGDPEVGMTQQALQLEQATNSAISAQASYKAATEGASASDLEQARAAVEKARSSLQALLDSPTPPELASAEAQVKQAEAQFAAVSDGASAEQLAVAEAQVAQARLSLETARANLAKATLAAPFDGIVTAVHVAEGEAASGPAVDLTDPASLQVVLNVDETDLGGLAVGQPAVITLETWPDQEIDGAVVSIAPKATASTSAIVAYEVHLALSATDLPVREGMTADADLITAARQNVLLAPNQAITPDRQAGKYYVDLVQPGPDGAISTKRVEVTVGLRDDDYTEITGGLNEGDQVLIAAAAAAQEPAKRSGLIPPAPGGMGGFGQ